MHYIWVVTKQAMALIRLKYSEHYRMMHVVLKTSDIIMEIFSLDTVHCPVKDI
jgi:hypothetical protein